MKRFVPGVTLLLLMLCPAFSRAAGQGGAAVGGVVRDLHGTPQMGALIELLGPDAAVVAQTFTDDHGRYLLSALSPGKYQLRASAAFLLPALRPNLRLAEGVRSMADLTMTAMVEVGAWFPAEKRSPVEPADDWRWTLRSTANRPLLRFGGDTDDSKDAVLRGESSPGSFEAAQLALGAETGGFGEGGTHQTVTVDRSVQVDKREALRADIAQPYSGEGATSVALSAGYERQTMLGGETRVQAGFLSQPQIAAPVSGANPDISGLETITLASTERLALGDAVMIDAGTLLSAERMVTSRVSAAPFLRVVVTPSAGLALMYRYAAGRALQSSADLDGPEVESQALSDAQGQPITVRDTHQELAVSHVVGSDIETLAVYEDDLPVGALQGGGGLAAREFAGLPILSDASTGTFRIAVGGYTAHGMSVSWTHSITPALAASLAADLGSALVHGAEPLTLASLQSSVRAHLSPALSATVHGRIAHSGTSFRAQYRWQPSATLDTVDSFNTVQNQAYLSCYLRQKLWSGRRLQGVNAVVEATNLLEEGYQPMLGPDGETLFLAQVPRTLQAGLSFNF